MAKLNTPYVSGIEASDDEETTLIGFMGIDTGTLALGDPVYIDEVTGAVDEYLDGFKHEKYLAVKDTTTNFPDAIYGALISTGIGDGFYPVYVTTTNVDGWGKRVSRVEIVFMEDEDKEPDEVEA